MYIYKTIVLPTKEIYIGQSMKDSHKSVNYFGSGLNLRNRIIEYGIESCNKKILLNYIDTKKNLDILEKMFIKVNRKNYGKKCINIARGGEGNFRLKRTEEFKKALSKRRTGSKHLEDTKNKISKTLKGHEVSQKTRNKISRSLIGHIPWNKGKKTKPHTKEWKINMSKMMIGKNHPMYGKHHSEKARIKMSNARKGKTLKELGHKKYCNCSFCRNKNS